MVQKLDASQNIMKEAKKFIKEWRKMLGTTWTDKKLSPWIRGAKTEDILMTIKNKKIN